MGRRGGFSGGMPGNMNNILKQAKKMQKQLAEQQEAMEQKVFTATAGGGVVEVQVNGKKEVLSVKLKEEVVDPEDVEMLQDLIVACVNEAMKKVDEEMSKGISSFSGAMGGLGF